MSPLVAAASLSGAPHLDWVGGGAAFPGQAGAGCAGRAGARLPERRRLGQALDDPGMEGVWKGE